MRAAHWTLTKRFGKGYQLQVDVLLDAGEQIRSGCEPTPELVMEIYNAFIEKAAPDVALQIDLNEDGGK